MTYAGLHQTIPERRFVSLSAATSLPPQATAPTPVARAAFARHGSVGPPAADRSFARTVSMPTERSIPLASVGDAVQQPYQGLAALRAAAGPVAGQGSPTAPTRGLGAGRAVLGRATTVAAARPSVGPGAAAKGKDRETGTRTRIDQLYLGTNLLTVLPSELFQLESLTVLSLSTCQVCLSSSRA